MVAAGHFSPLEHLRVQAEQAEAKAQWQRAQHQALASREKLSRLLGLSTAQRDFRLPGSHGVVSVCSGTQNR